MISATEGMLPEQNLEIVDAILCVLMYYFDQIKFEKSTIIY